MKKSINKKNKILFLKFLLEEPLTKDEMEKVFFFDLYNYLTDFLQSTIQKINESNSDRDTIKLQKNINLIIDNLIRILENLKKMQDIELSIFSLKTIIKNTGAIGENFDENNYLSDRFSKLHILSDFYLKFLNDAGSLEVRGGHKRHYTHNSFEIFHNKDLEKCVIWREYNAGDGVVHVDDGEFRTVREFIFPYDKFVELNIFYKLIEFKANDFDGSKKNTFLSELSEYEYSTLELGDFISTPQKIGNCRLRSELEWIKGCFILQNSLGDGSQKDKINLGKLMYQLFVLNNAKETLSRLEREIK